MDYFIERESFTTYSKEPVAVLNIRHNVFDLVTNLQESELLVEFIKKTEYDPNIMALMIINDPGCLGEDEYDRFIHDIIDHQTESDKDNLPGFTQKNIRFREINILNKIIKAIAEYQKLCFSAIRGDIVTPFIGASLAADFRYITENSRLIMAHNKFGLHPSGAMPFFLGHYLGHSRAMKIQLTASITAENALELGLVDELLSDTDFEESCLDKIHGYLHCRTCTIRRTKQLTSFIMRDLHDYFQFEASLLNL
ncbi:MAG: enoyl-CoA hydratase/isomerase family protein [Bacteroidales bacterium]